MLAFDANTDTERILHEAVALEAALLALGAADEVEAVAQAIADSARQFTDAVLVTLTVPSVNGSETQVIVSGGMAADDVNEAGVDQLLVCTFSLQTERHNDETLPVLRIHGAYDRTGTRTMTVVKRFAPHARLALDRAHRFAAIKRLAYSDPLTGLANARGLQDALEQTARVANAENRALALLIIDLDDFRRYNTLWGHLVGDAALQAFAQAIRSAMRGHHFVARVGGEEFAVLLPDADEHEARAVAARIHEAIAGGGSGLPSPFTASIGIGVYPNDVPDAASLYAVADTAMTMAKRAGKNRTFLFETIA
ncbi:MAG: GGDEF domain-containing protein [Thermomicrobia bacterium]|nr:GGDEF domain-containing protein [Thermomicrobia bacterium]